MEEVEHFEQVDWGRPGVVAEAVEEEPLRAMLFCSRRKHSVRLVLLSSFPCVHSLEEVVAEVQEAQICHCCSYKGRIRCRSLPRSRSLILE